MDITPKRIYYDKNIAETINYYIEDDQLRLVFIVILVIGLILLLTGIKVAAIFLIVGFGLIAFMCLFRPPKSKLLENFVCDSLMIQSTLEGLDEDPEHTLIGVSMLEERNCQIKFRNSSRNKK